MPPSVSPQSGRSSWPPTPADDGQRLDLFLAGRLPQLSRSRLQALVREGHLRQGERLIDEPGHRVKPGERFVLDVPPPRAAEPAAEAAALEILFEDEHLIVLVKPAGMVVHPAPGHADGTLVNALLAHCGASLSGIGGVLRPGIVHRLDREVSGVMVAAKHDRAHIGLAGQFSVHSIDRVYEAMVWGVPGAAAGSVDRPLGRHPGRSQADGDRVAGRQARGDPLAAAGGGRHPRRAAGVRAGDGPHPPDPGARGEPGPSDRRRPALRPRPAGACRGGRGHRCRLDRILLHARRLGFIHPVTGAALTLRVGAAGQLRRDS